MPSDRHLTPACVEFAMTDVADPEAVARFVYWLWNRKWPEEAEEDAWGFLYLENEFSDDVRSPQGAMEYFWDWDAPRPRMAKLLWDCLQDAAPSRRERRGMILDVDALTEGARYCGKALAQIKGQLAWVLDSIENIGRVSTAAGQAAWGEDWFLPPEQLKLVRSRLSRTKVQVLERESDYQRFLEGQLDDHSTSVWRFVPTALADPIRTYVGECREANKSWNHEEDFVVHVEASGRRKGLVNAREPWSELPGMGFAWGYRGTGPANLAMSILADAVGGDLVIPQAHFLRFKDRVIAKLPRSGFQMSHTQVLDWLAQEGVDGRDLESASADHQGRIRKHRGAYEHLREQLEVSRIAGGLRKQRFDIVPEDFETALYVDLMDMLKSGGRVMRCSECKLPMPYDGTGRSNRQRARWAKGEAIFHERCWAESRARKKADDWKRRSQSQEFRERRRLQATERRRVRQAAGAPARNPEPIVRRNGTPPRDPMLPP